jgi:hypothetical protein
MIRPSILILAAAAAAPPSAWGHFLFVTPDGAGRSARVFLSETLEPDPAVGTKLTAGAAFKLRGAAGTGLALELKDGAGFRTLELPGEGPRLVHGRLDMGVSAKYGGAQKPYLLLYHPKAVVGDPFAAAPPVTGGAVPVEIVPAGRPGAVVLRLLAHGKAHAHGEITVIQPDGTTIKLTTNAAGETGPLSRMGRYGAWARFFEPGSGQRDGVQYAEVRHYATLVFDANAPAASKFVTLPEATSSFGGAAAGGWLYVYGGHTGPAHTYSTEAVSGSFSRLPLAQGGQWEALPPGPPMQGLNLTAHAGKIYRIGGMTPRNKPGEPADNHSLAGCAVFDPERRVWESFPPLPEARSSHDAAVIDGKVIVTGGWTIKGKEVKWLETIAVLDLNSPAPEWKSFPQPFKRRALAAAVHRGRMYVIGGLNDKNQVVPDVTIYDPRSNAWLDGPRLPDGPGRAFAPGAILHQGRLTVSVSDGTVYQLNDESVAWEAVGKATARVQHRLISHGASLLILGGSHEGANSDLVESFPLLSRQ